GVLFQRVGALHHVQKDEALSFLRRAGGVKAHLRFPGHYAHADDVALLADDVDQLKLPKHRREQTKGTAVHTPGFHGDGNVLTVGKAKAHPNVGHRFQVENGRENEVHRAESVHIVDAILICRGKVGFGAPGEVTNVSHVDLVAQDLHVRHPSMLG